MEPDISTPLWLTNVIGRSARWGDLMFVPVLFETDERLDSDDEHTLSAVLGSRNLVDLDVRYGDTNPPRYQGLWVRARLPIVFGFAPAIELNHREQLMECPFFAIFDHHGRTEAHGFVCSDPDLEPTLEFFRQTGAELSARIAAAFWGLLLADTEAVASFQAEVSLEYDQSDYCRVEAGYWGGRYRLYYDIDPLTCEPM